MHVPSEGKTTRGKKKEDERHEGMARRDEEDEKIRELKRETERTAADKKCREMEGTGDRRVSDYFSKREIYLFMRR